MIVSDFGFEFDCVVPVDEPRGGTYTSLISQQTLPKRGLVSRSFGSVVSEVSTNQLVVIRFNTPGSKSASSGRI